MNKSGIYILVNNITNGFYIGSTVSFSRRKAVHFSQLRRNCHSNRYMQRSWNKHKNHVFKFKILLICEHFELLRYEQLLLDRLKPTYNAWKTVDRPSKMDRRHHSEGTKRKIGLGNKGKIILKYQRQAVANANKNRIVSPETREKMRLSKLGNKNPFYGKTITDKNKARMAEGYRKWRERRVK